ncbi:MAG TPA: secretin N-terminal domain-containing protein, partial [Gemmatimonadaceae bacterium]|nr:secretin N-terminal domain-containing protein [Gemmatimonadaceae bacterium]
MTSTIRRLLPLALLAVLLPEGGALPAGAQQPVVPPGARATPQGVLIDLQDTEVRSVITALAEAAGINVTFGDLPARRITLRMRQPVPVDSVRPLLRSIAEANGLRVTDSGGLLRFEGIAPPQPVAVAPQALPGAVQLYVYRLRHARAARLAATLQAIFGGGAVSDVATTGPIPLSQRLRDQQIPSLRLDTLNRGRVEVMPVAPGLSGRVQSQVQIVPDENTNSLLVRASAADWEVVRQAIQVVDLRPLQALIEVLIAEVRRTRDF